MSRSGETADPLRRRVALVVILGAAGSVLLGAIELWLGLLAAVVAGIALSALLTRQLSPLRQHFAALTERSGLAPTPGEMVDLLERAEERSTAQHDLLRRERDDLVDILHATANGVLLLDEDDRIRLVNDAARRLLGPATDPLGRRLPEVVRNLDILQAVERARSGRATESCRVELHAPTGMRSLRTWAVRMPSRHPERRVVVVLDDISDLQHLERVRTDFVANVTHEMRSPLTAIIGFAETLDEESSEFGEVAQRSLQRIRSNAQRLQNIIDDLVRLSRLEHAGDAEHARIDPRELLDRVCEPFREACADKRQTLTLDLGDLPAAMPLDAELVGQALTNLLDNAVKYTPEGGRVVVRARLDGPVVRFEVNDNGPGIAKEHQQRIFERFYRVDAARSRAIGGTGLGLAIVKHAAALHGGQVLLESAPGRGTTFTLRIPVEDES